MPVALTEVWEKGGAGGEALGAELLALLDKKGAEFRPLYPTESADQGEDRHHRASRSTAATAPTIRRRPIARSTISSRSDLANTPVCMAKTQYSLTDDATKLGRPRGFRITVNEVRASAGAGFVVAQCGDIMTMPGLPKEPAAERMARLPSGEIVGPLLAAPAAPCAARSSLDVVGTNRARVVHSPASAGLIAALVVRSVVTMSKRPAGSNQRFGSLWCQMVGPACAAQVASGRVLHHLLTQSSLSSRACHYYGHARWIRFLCLRLHPRLRDPRCKSFVNAGCPS